MMRDLWPLGCGKTLVWKNGREELGCLAGGEGAQVGPLPVDQAAERAAVAAAVVLYAAAVSAPAVLKVSPVTELGAAQRFALLQVGGADRLIVVSSFSWTGEGLSASIFAGWRPLGATARESLAGLVAQDLTRSLRLRLTSESWRVPAGE